MPKSLIQLKREAIQTCRQRRHIMDEFETNRERTRALSHCLCCPAWVQVETNPLPNSIDIGGPAVTQTCAREIALNRITRNTYNYEGSRHNGFTNNL